MTGRPRAEFIAIAVGQGDAFFLRCEGLRVLVDGGRSVNGFPALFRTAAGETGVDILICTHSDRDHANGVLGFLQSALSVREVWLPGSWTPRLKDLLCDPVPLIEELGREVQELPVPYPRDLATLGDRYSKVGKDRETEQERGDYNEPLIDLMEQPRETVDLEKLRRQAMRTYGLWPHAPGDPHQRVRQRLFAEAISAAHMIREITAEAFRRRIGVRWFEYRAGAVPNHNLNPQPVNCEEILRIPPRVSALEYLALTRSNRESLVFVATAASACPPVLFAADSPLTFSAPIPWAPGMIVTAPHHGAEANAPAYWRFTREAPGSHALWVRSDGWFRRRPGPSYRSAPGTRFCTRCWGRPGQWQHVRLGLVGCRWTPQGASRCSC